MTSIGRGERVRSRTGISWWGAVPVALVVAIAMAANARAQQPERPTFRARVAVVPITAVVRDSRNRVVKDLKREDFQVIEQRHARPILEFSANTDGPVSVAVLFDTSGSMGLASNFTKGKAVVAQLVERLDPERDEMALFTFHKTLREEVPFTTDKARLRRAVDNVKPWGLTSLYDAVAETAKRLPDPASARRAIVVISDGVDTSSAMTSREVAALASSIDVPVYVVAVVSPLDHPTHPAAVVPENTGGGLIDLAQFTGGEVLFVSAYDPSVEIHRLLSEMRHQYFLAIESAAAPGWYELDVKTKRPGLTVRARRAYSAGLPGVPE